jgi:RluA family pseudouridine synthase
VDWLIEQYPKIKGVGETERLANGTIIERPGIVHRLDRDTSGVLLIAKTSTAFIHLKSQFQNRQVQKTYNAFVYGRFNESVGEIDRPIGKNASDFRLWSAQPGARGQMRPAHTSYQVLAQGNVQKESVSYIEARPHTGRTHQIRVHLKAVHHPVVCDPLYAPKRPCLLGFKRLALHARLISFTDFAGGFQTVEAPLPADFIQALSEFTVAGATSSLV